MNWLRNLLHNNWFTRKLYKIRSDRKYKKRLAEIKKRDPYIYK